MSAWIVRRKDGLVFAWDQFGDYWSRDDERALQLARQRDAEIIAESEKDCVAEERP